MRSRCIVPAVVRDGRRLRLRGIEQPTLSEDGTLLEITRVRAALAVRTQPFQRRRSLTGLARATGRQVLSLLGLL
jgi:hypothetical protein